MQIIARTSLVSFLTGPIMDPEKELQEEMSAFAEMINNRTPDEVTHFVFVDHENGDDAQINWESNGHERSESEDLIPLTYNRAGTSYYGMSRSWNKYNVDLTRAIYNCYLGGSPLNSAPGFVISCAGMIG